LVVSVTIRGREPSDSALEEQMASLLRLRRQ
jgi:hypothetical protein